RRAVRPHSQPADRRLRRRGQHHAGVRLLHGAVRARQHGAPGDLGLRRRVPGDPRQLQCELLVLGARGRDAGAGRRLHAVAGEARDIRTRDEPARRGARGPERSRIRGAVGARARGAGRRGVARAAAEGHAADHPSPGRAGDRHQDLTSSAVHEIVLTWSSVAAAVPEISLTAAICLILLVDVFAGERARRVTPTLTLLALSVYAMVAFDRDSGVCAESAMKYFVLGAIASGALLYGMSLIYGLTGTLDLAEIAARLRAPNTAGVILGLTFIVVAVAFKLGAVPFHMWLPDVYEGAPTSVTLFIGTAPKFAYFALALRLL